MPRTAKAKSENPVLINMLRPRDPEKEAVHGRAYLRGETFNLSQGTISKDAYNKLIVAQGKALDEGSKVIPLIPNMFSPVTVELGRKLGAKFALPGRQETTPEGWNDHLLGKWNKNMCLHYYRMMHARDIRKLVEEGGLVSIDGTDFVVSTTGKDGIAAPFLIRGNKGGNYAINHAAVKTLGYPNMRNVDGDTKVTKTEFAAVVGRIESAKSADGKPDVTIETWENGNKIVFLPNQIVTWGHLIKDGKILTPTSVRSLKDLKGITFSSVRWISVGITEPEFWEEVRRSSSLASTKNNEGKTELDRLAEREGRSGKKDSPRNKAWKNISDTQCRGNPATEVYCYGFRLSTVGQSVGVRWEVVDGQPVETVFVCLGGHLVVDLTIVKWTAVAAIKSAAVAVASVVTKVVKTLVDKTKKGKTVKKEKTEPVIEIPIAVAETLVPPVESDEIGIPDDIVLDVDEDVDEDDIAEAELDAEQRDASLADIESVDMD